MLGVAPQQPGEVVIPLSIARGWTRVIPERRNPGVGLGALFSHRGPLPGDRYTLLG